MIMASILYSSLRICSHLIWVSTNMVGVPERNPPPIINQDKLGQETHLIRPYRTRPDQIRPEPEEPACRKRTVNIEYDHAGLLCPGGNLLGFQVIDVLAKPVAFP